MTGASEGEDLTPAMLRRLHDEDPQVVIAVTDSDVLQHRVLLARRIPNAPQTDKDGIEGGHSDCVSSRAAVLASAAATAAFPWLSALSEARPKHPVAEAGKVVCGLLRLASAAIVALAAGKEEDGGDQETAAKATRQAALRLFLECLPGPHANARVKAAQRAAASCGREGTAVVDASGRACKKALRAIGRTAIEVMGVFDGRADVTFSLFIGLGKILERSSGKEAGSVTGSKKGKGRASKVKDGNAMEVEGGECKSQGLKAMGDEVCDVLAAAFADKTEMLQVRRPRGVQCLVFWGYCTGTHSYPSRTVS